MRPRFFKVDVAHRSLHLWAGPLGMHLYWPDLWKSRPDYCRGWRGKA